MKRLRPLSPRSSQLSTAPALTGRQSVGRLPALPSRAISASTTPNRLSTLRLVPAPSRVLGFDLENRPLAYWYPGETTAEITAFGWKWTDEPDAHVLVLKRDGAFVSDDGRRFPPHKAYSFLRELVASAGLVFGHNIRRHDLPLLQAGLLRLGLEPLPVLLTTDTLSDYPKRRSMSASLENLAAMYGLDGEKLHMSQVSWERANRLRPDGIELARERVVSDVLLQERLRERLLQLGVLGAPRRWLP